MAGLLNEVDKIGRGDHVPVKPAMRDKSVFSWWFIAKKLALGAFLSIAITFWGRACVLFILARYNPHGLPLGRGWTPGDWIVDAVLITPFGCGLGAYMAVRCVLAKKNIGALRYAVYFLASSLSVIALANLYSIAVGNWEVAVDADFAMLLWGVILAEIMIRRRPLD